MNVKSLLLGTLLGGLTLFVWGSLTHTLLIPEPVTELKDAKATLDYVTANAPKAGTYMDRRGVLVVNAMRADRSDKSQDMGPELLAELASNFVQAALLFFVFRRLEPSGAMRRACLGATLGLAGWVGLTVSWWNWYGLSPLLIAQDAIDAAVGCALAALVLRWSALKWGA